jgi:ribosomal protein S18 acetylase RimI-like enzyme
MIKECNINHSSDIVALAYKLNNIPESNSAFCFKDYEAIKDDFTYMLNSKENLVIGYFDNDILIGVTGFVIDEINRTADWVGPFIQQGEYIDIAKKMLDYAMIKLPNTKEFNFFFNCKNVLNKKFLEGVNAQYITNEFNLTIERSSYNLNCENHTWDEMYISGINNKNFMKEKFNEVILNTNESSFSGPPGKKVFYLTMEDDLIGYGTYSMWNNSGRASIHMIHVMPELLGINYEEYLLKELIHHIYQDSNIHTIGIVLEKKDEFLIDICIKLGFEITAENYSYILKVK